MTPGTESMVQRLKLLLGGDELPLPVQKEPAIPTHGTAELTSSAEGEIASRDLAEDISNMNLNTDKPCNSVAQPELSEPPAKPANIVQPPNALPILGQDHIPYQAPIVGQLADIQCSFTPIVAASRIPYKFVGSKSLSERIANAFFNDGKFWRWGWSIYYIWPPQSKDPKPLLLVLSSEIDALFSEINRTIDGASLSLTQLADREASLKIIFPYEHPRLRPRYLGRCYSREEYDTLGRRCPGEGYQTPRDPSNDMISPPTESQANDCDLKIETAQDVAHSGKSRKRVRSQGQQNKERIRERTLDQSLAQIERFFGFRPGKFQEPPNAEWQPISWQESQAREAAKQALKNVEPIDVTRSAPYPFDSDAILISIDLEWYEKDPGKVTEIGIAALDTSDLCKVAPGPNGVNWYPFVRSRHFRIREWAHYVNSEYVQGCPNAFRFGDSEFIGLDKVPKTVATCFRPPYSSAHHTSGESADAKRTIVIVGHDVAGDLRYLRRHGYDVTNLLTLHHSCPIADTQELYRALKKQQDNPKLASVLQEFDIEAWALHNAGNDATYTMKALIAIAVNSAGSRKQ